MEDFDHVDATKTNFDASIALYAKCIFIIMNMCKHTHHMSMFLRGSWISWSKRENCLGPIRYRLWNLRSSCQAGLVLRTIPSLARGRAKPIVYQPCMMFCVSLFYDNMHMGSSQVCVFLYVILVLTLRLNMIIWFTKRNMCTYLRMVLPIHQ